MNAIEWGEVTETWVKSRVESFTSAGVFYETSVAPDSFDEFDCSCPAMLYDPTEPCKHVELVWENLWEVL